MSSERIIEPFLVPSRFSPSCACSLCGFLRLQRWEQGGTRPARCWRSRTGREKRKEGRHQAQEVRQQQAGDTRANAPTIVTCIERELRATCWLQKNVAHSAAARTGSTGRRGGREGGGSGEHATSPSMDARGRFPSPALCSRCCLCSPGAGVVCLSNLPLAGGCPVKRTTLAAAELHSNQRRRRRTDNGRDSGRADTIIEAQTTHAGRGRDAS